MSMEPKTDVCKGCGRPMWWLRNEHTGKAGPIDTEPSPTGNVRVDLIAGTWGVIPRASREAVPPDQRFTNHSATCPQASQFGRKAAAK